MFHIDVHRCGRCVLRRLERQRTLRRSSGFRSVPKGADCGKHRVGAVRLYSPLLRARTTTRRRETHLSTQRSTPEAASRVPRADVNSRRPRHPQAPPCPRPQAAVRLRRAVQRRNRLSRSKDFDAVYRRGRSASTRYLVLHWFPRDDDPNGEPRLGLAVPRGVGSAVARNRVKRLLRESWRELLPSVPAGQDYVLSARPGLAEPADVRGKDWLVGEIADVLEKARS